MNPKVAFVCGGYQPQLDGVSDYVRRLLSALSGHIEPLLVTQPDWRLPDLVRMLLHLRQTRPDIVHVQYAPVSFRWRRSVQWLPPLAHSLVPRAKIVVTGHEVEPRTRGLFRRADVVIATTPEHAQRIAEVPDVQLIPIGPNVDRAPGDPSERAAQARSRWSVPACAPLIVFFGFLHPVKGLEYLVRAMPHVCRECAGARLVLAGGWRSLALPGAEGDAYHARLQSIILELNLGAVVTITGYLPEADVSGLLFAADVVALPFTFGLSYKSGSLLAALAHARAVIGTRAPIDDPRLRAGEHFVAVPPRDADALADALTSLLRDEPGRRRIANNGAAAARPFNWSTIARRHLELYSRLV